MSARISRARLSRLLALLGWTRASYYLLSAFLLTVFLIAYIWWPLAEEALAYVDWQGPWWLYMDWLLLGIFAVMSLLIMSGADLRRDTLTVVVGLAGGLVIEAWGTQTNLWFYYTNERPPLWIIPAWSIASLSIDRLTRLLGWLLPQRVERHYRLAYWLVFPAFFALMLAFIAPTLDKSFTWGALLLTAAFIFTPGEPRIALLTFAAGSALGYYLELWGTTRQCWTYYTYQTPPLFAVLAHGMAAVAFWRAGKLLAAILARSPGLPAPRAASDRPHYLDQNPGR
jgi:hypothetical protein